MSSIVVSLLSLALGAETKEAQTMIAHVKTGFLCNASLQRLQEVAMEFMNITALACLTVN